MIALALLLLGRILITLVTGEIKALLRRVRINAQWEDLPVDRPIIKSFICYLLILMGVGNALACGVGQFLRRPYYLVIAVPVIVRAPRVKITR